MGPDENGSRFKPGAIFALGPDGEKYEPVVFTSFLNPEAYAPLQQVREQMLKLQDSLRATKLTFEAWQKLGTALQASFQEDLKRINATTYRLFNPRFKENHAARGSAFPTRNNTRHEHFY